MLPKINISIIVLAVILFIIAMKPSVVMAVDDAELSVEVLANSSSGDFAPFFIGSLNHGKTTQKSSALADIAFVKDLDLDSRFSWGIGAEVLAGAQSQNIYQRWDQQINDWIDNPQKPSSFWLQQLYAEAKYRSVFLSVGLKEHSAALLNPDLSSGDFVESGNARPIPEIRSGFVDFVDIPLTNGWVQINGQVAYGKMTDSKYIADRYNYYNYHIGKDAFYAYKYCFLRSNPEQRLMVTVGMQAATIFGGETQYYYKGECLKTNKYDSNLGTFVKMLMPVVSQDEDFAPGSSIGSWDFYSQYLLNDDNEIAAYFQWPFEDGSGIARRNKLDGVWGLEFRSSAQRVISGIVLEYIDFRDQSGPIHYAPDDNNTPTITQGTSGRDNYYNNAYYNSYANYGMSIGTPFLISPIYNLNGYPAFECNRANGFHLGVSGFLRYNMPYRLLLSHQRGLGTYSYPYYQVRTDTSVMVECNYQINSNFNLKMQVAADRGSLRGNNFGALLSVRYRCAFPH